MRVLESDSSSSSSTCETIRLYLQLRPVEDSCRRTDNILAACTAFGPQGIPGMEGRENDIRMV